MPSWQHESVVVIDYHYNYFSRLNLFLILIIPLKQQKETKFDALKTAKKIIKLRATMIFALIKKYFKNKNQINKKVVSPKVDLYMQWILILLSPCHYWFVKPKFVFLILLFVLMYIFNILPLTNTEETSHWLCE